MFLGVLTGKRELLQPPSEMTDDLMMIQHNPSVRDMLRYSFVGRKEAVKKQLERFLEETGVDEIMVVSNLHGHEDRVNSYAIVSEIMQELNA
ncbi:hypothetical protein D3C80_1942360 [compost metagenome]